MRLTPKALRVLQRRAWMIQRRIVQHETENGKVACHDRDELEALVEVFHRAQVDPNAIPVVPENKIPPRPRVEYGSDAYRELERQASEDLRVTL